MAAGRRISAFVKRIGIGPLLAATALLFPHITHGADPQKGRQLQIIETLRNSGMEFVGGFSLKEFQEQVNQIEWRSLEGAPPAVMSGSRESAYYLWKQYKVWISNNLPAEAAASRAQLELHEAFGAVGIEDDDYARSTVLNLLSKIAPGPKRSSLAILFSDMFPHRQVLTAGGKGSGTGVSGGGDLVSLYIKDQVLSYVTGREQLLSTVKDNFLLHYPLIRFEAVNDSSQPKVAIKYQYLVLAGRETFTVLVPMTSWRRGSRDAVIAEIATKLTSIFPAHVGATTHTFKPELCTSTAMTVDYPQTIDPDIRIIQHYRGAIQLGCYRFSRGLTDISLIAPAIATGAQPRAAGSYGFACEFRMGGIVDPHTILVPAGKSTQASRQFSITREKTVFAFIDVSADGKILSTSITYKDPGAERPRLERQPGAFSQMPIDGQMLSFSCRKER